MPDIQFTPTDGNGVIYVRSESDIPENPDPSIVYMLWDGVDYRNAVRYEVSGGDVGRDGPVIEYTAETLPDPASLAVGRAVIVDGVKSIVSGGELVSVRNNNSNSFAVVGDSYSANLVQFSTDTQIRCNNYSYLYHALGLCGRRMQITSFNAVGGTGFFTHTPVFNDQLTSAIASGAKNLIFMGGFNDVYNDNYAISTVIAEAKKFLDRVKLSGMRLFLCTQPGPSSGVWNYSYNNTGKMQQLQEFYRQYAAANASTDVILVDCAAVATDPASASMSYRAGYAVSDNVHPTNLGSYAMGKLLASKIASVLPPAGELSSSNYATYAYNSSCKNMLANGLFVDGPSGAPTGWTITNDS
ncbi:MAG: SGNH/GDSL hydrolase family protein, partial [Aeromonadaceae bacterium]